MDALLLPVVCPPLLASLLSLFHLQCPLLILFPPSICLGLTTCRGVRGRWARSTSCEAAVGKWWWWEGVGTQTDASIPGQYPQEEAVEWSSWECSPPESMLAAFASCQEVASRALPHGPVPSSTAPLPLPHLATRSRDAHGRLSSSSAPHWTPPYSQNISEFDSDAFYVCILRYIL